MQVILLWLINFSLFIPKLFYTKSSKKELIYQWFCEKMCRLFIAMNTLKEWWWSDRIDTHSQDILIVARIFLETSIILDVCYYRQGTSLGSVNSIFYPIFNPESLHQFRNASELNKEAKESTNGMFKYVTPVHIWAVSMILQSQADLEKAKNNLE